MYGGVSGSLSNLFLQAFIEQLSEHPYVTGIVSSDPTAGKDGGPPPFWAFQLIGLEDGLEIDQHIVPQAVAVVGGTPKKPTMSREHLTWGRQLGEEIT